MNTENPSDSRNVSPVVLVTSGSCGANIEISYATQVEKMLMPAIGAAVASTM